MLRIILLLQFVFLMGCFHAKTGGLTPTQGGVVAVDSQGNPISSDTQGIEDTVAIVDKGIIEGDNLLDLEQADEVAVIEQKRHKVIEQKLQVYQDNKEINLAFVVYFEFDSVDISEDSLLDISKHVDFLRANPDIKLRLLGHTDERGSREYNLALGENRGLAVARVLELYNIRDIEVVSYGEERSIDGANNEEAWSLNRRVEFVYY